MSIVNNITDKNKSTNYGNLIYSDLYDFQNFLVVK